MLALNPFGVGIACGRFAGELEPAFRRAFEKCGKEMRGNVHAGVLLFSVGFGKHLLLVGSQSWGDSAATSCDFQALVDRI